MKETMNPYSSKLDALPDDSFVFGSLFMIANQLQTVMDREFQPFDMTSKQWFMSIIISTLFDSPPTLGEVALAMGSTHQNVKQVALKLQSKGFLEIRADEQDGRAVRLVLTQKSRDFWASMNERSEHFRGGTFNGLTADEKAALRSALAKILVNTDELSKRK
jgi:MarR family transcriptional regulator, transcriptional regulator for hemolysin